MGKHEKNSRKTLSEKAILATALIQLIKALIELINKLIE